MVTSSAVGPMGFPVFAVGSRGIFISAYNIMHRMRPRGARGLGKFGQTLGSLHGFYEQRSYAALGNCYSSVFFLCNDDYYFWYSMLLRAIFQRMSASVSELKCDLNIDSISYWSRCGSVISVSMDLVGTRGWVWEIGADYCKRSARYVHRSIARCWGRL
jgi:hypothetical protein